MCKFIWHSSLTLSNYYLLCQSLSYSPLLTSFRTRKTLQIYGKLYVQLNFELLFKFCLIFRTTTICLCFLLFISAFYCLFPSLSLSLFYCSSILYVSLPFSFLVQLTPSALATQPLTPLQFPWRLPSFLHLITGNALPDAAAAKICWPFWPCWPNWRLANV